MKETSGASSKRIRRSKTGRFNFIDLLLVVVILFTVGALIYVYVPNSIVQKITSDKTVEIEYAIEIIGVEKDFINNIKENEVVLDSVSKNKLGTVILVENENQYKELIYTEPEAETSDNGEYTDIVEKKEGVLSPVGEKRNVIVYISANAEYEAGKGYSINGIRIAVGEKMYLRFPNYVCEAYCILLD